MTAVAAAGLAVTAACVSTAPAPRSISAVDLFRDASFDIIHARALAPCGRDNGALRALERTDARLDAIVPWLRGVTGDEAFERLGEEIGMEAGTFDPLCSARGFDAWPLVRRSQVLTRELERRAAVAQPLH